MKSQAKRRKRLPSLKRTKTLYGELLEIGGINHDDNDLDEPVESPIRVRGRQGDKLKKRVEMFKNFKEELKEVKRWKLDEFKEMLANKVKYNSGKAIDELTPVDWFIAISGVVRDRLIELWDETETRVVNKNPKRCYYLSIEYLLGRAFKNALLNLGIEKEFRKKLNDVGLSLDEMVGNEKDAGLGNGGLGRLAACFLDSMATLDLPAWGYGLRYDYGIFKQDIKDGFQVEVPDYWLTNGSPFEIERKNINYEIQFYGKVITTIDDDGKTKASWKEGEKIIARAYDNPIPGYGGHTAINLRLWKALPFKRFCFKEFNAGNYHAADSNKRFAAQIRSLLYPNDNLHSGKALRLKQQYFFVSATIQDIMNKFWRKNKDWSKLKEKVAVQLNDTHPSLGIVEMMRILIDYERIEFNAAFDIVKEVFSYTNHTVLPEALEKWGVPMFEQMLPRHLQIIYEMNYVFMAQVSAKYPYNTQKLRDLSMIEESNPKLIRMANLSIVGSKRVNGVARIHSELIKANIFKDFFELWPEKFTNVTNGVTIRRWINQANPKLSDFYKLQLGNKDWLFNLEQLKKLNSFADNTQFQKVWLQIKKLNKQKLASWLKAEHNFEVDPNSAFDIMIKRLHEYKRQLMFTFYVIHRYFRLKQATPEERKKFVPKTCMIGGKAAPGYLIAKKVIKLIHCVSDVINKDPETSNYLKLFFVPNYNVSAAELLIPAAEFNEHISCAGTEASGTSNMKFVMNGGIIIGTKDGANIEIAEEIGEDNIIFFGNTVEKVEERRMFMRSKDYREYMPPVLLKVIESIESGYFGDCESLKELMGTIKNRNDFYLVGADFCEYLDAQKRADDLYKDKAEFAKRSIKCALNMGKFSTDRTMKEYAEKIWGIEPVGNV